VTPLIAPFESFTPMKMVPPFEFKNPTMVLRILSLRNDSLIGKE